MTNDELVHVGRSLLSGNPDARARAAARRAIGSGEGEELFSVLLHDQRRISGTESDALQALMQCLETLMEVDALVAGYLMTKLYDVAGRAFMHDICDAIGLWLEDKFGDAVVNSPTAGYRDQYRRLAAHLQKACAENVF